MMALRTHSRTHSGAKNWQSPTTTSQFLTTGSQDDVQISTQLNGSRSIGG
jgi:hypothetical protein